MKNNQITVAWLGLFSVLASFLPTAQAQGTAFTYQGRLSADGAAANGSYHLASTLYTDSTGGSVLAGAVSPTAPSQLAEAKPIPWSEIGAKAGAQYSGDRLSVGTDARGRLRIRCVFQKMEGEITAEGLWLTSTATEGSAPIRPRLPGLMLAKPSITAFPDLGLAQVASMSLTSVSVPLHPQPALR